MDKPAPTTPGYSDDQDDEGDGEQTVDDAHEDAVDDAADEAADQAVDDADSAGDEHGYDADQHGYAAAGDDAAEDVAAELVAAQGVSELAIRITRPGSKRARRLRPSGSFGEIKGPKRANSTIAVTIRLPAMPTGLLSRIASRRTGALRRAGMVGDTADSGLTAVLGVHGRFLLEFYARVKHDVKYVDDIVNQNKRQGKK